MCMRVWVFISVRSIWPNFIGPKKTIGWPQLFSPCMFVRVCTSMKSSWAHSSGPKTVKRPQIFTPRTLHSFK